MFLGYSLVHHGQWVYKLFNFLACWSDACFYFQKEINFHYMLLLACYASKIACR